MNQVVTNSGAAAQYYDVAKTMQNKKAAKAENNAAPAKKSQQVPRQIRRIHMIIFRLKRKRC